jgi:hypothetical protein
MDRHQDDPSLLGGPVELPRALRIQREGLLAQKMFPALEDLLADLQVGGARRRQDDKIQIARIIEKSLYVLVLPDSWITKSNPLKRFRRRIADSDQGRSSGQPPRRKMEFLDDIATPDNPEAKLAH